MTIKQTQNGGFTIENIDGRDLGFLAYATRTMANNEEFLKYVKDSYDSENKLKQIKDNVEMLDKAFVSILPF